MTTHNVIISREAQLIRQRFPQFKLQYIHRVPTWFGTLQPLDESPVYRVKITYPERQSPKVWIISPSLQSNAPHRYSDKSLCLYHPDDKSWNKDSRIATSIILWTAEWLMFYEYWLITGVWHGPEAPHAQASSPGKV